jgi:hypothetical protein
VPYSLPLPFEIILPSAQGSERLALSTGAVIKQIKDAVLKCV